MEYLKEFQTFAGRVSAAADERLNRFDGGTYTEFFRLYSQRWSANVRLMASMRLEVGQASIGSIDKFTGPKD